MKLRTVAGGTRTGMTLIELVLALAIGGITMSAGYAALATMVDRRQQANEVLDQVMADAAIRRALAAWISGAELTVEEDDVVFRGLDGVKSGAPDDDLTFRTNSSSVPGGSGTVVRLFIDRSDSTSERGFVASLETRDPVQRRVVELEPQATSLDMRYLSRLGGISQWETSWVSSTVLPLAVELRVATSPPDSKGRLMSLPVLVALRGAR